jgi:hypothetical protein
MSSINDPAIPLSIDTIGVGVSYIYTELAAGTYVCSIER